MLEREFGWNTSAGNAASGPRPDPIAEIDASHVAAATRGYTIPGWCCAPGARGFFSYRLQAAAPVPAPRERISTSYARDLRRERGRQGAAHVAERRWSAGLMRRCEEAH